MKQEEILRTLEGIGAIITNTHVVYTSGRHGSAYVNKDAIYPHTGLISKLCREMAGRFRGEDIDVVAGPAIGGVILSQWVAHYLSETSGREVAGIFAEEGSEKERVFRRGYDKFIPGKNILVVEDVLTTGGSVKKVVDAVKKLGGRVVGCAALCNRGGITSSSLGAPKLDALINVSLESWEAGECPLCKKGVPINTEVGKGSKTAKVS